MKTLPNKVQHGVLFCLYLVTAGRATVKSASEGLGISVHNLQQAAHRLRKANVVKSVRGALGGFELVGEPKIGDILSAFGFEGLLTEQEVDGNKKSTSPERRAFGHFIDVTHNWIDAPLGRPIRELVIDLAQAEGAMLDSVNHDLMN